jgi:cytochrome b
MLNSSRRLVWDLPVRVIHWSLLFAVIGSWLTHELEGDWFAWHVRCGYAVLILVSTRLLWGIVGTRHARFSDFVRGPSAIAHYARSLRSGQAQQYVGHNPLGALMVLALLALLLAQALTGLFANDEILNTGPLYGYVSDALSKRLTGIHHLVFDLIEIAVALHVSAALFYLLVKKDNLILPMLTGKKQAADVPPAEAIRSSRAWLAALIAAVLGALLWYVVSHAPSSDPFAI